MLIKIQEFPRLLFILKTLLDHLYFANNPLHICDRVTNKFTRKYCESFIAFLQCKRDKYDRDNVSRGNNTKENYNFIGCVNKGYFDLFHMFLLSFILSFYVSSSFLPTVLPFSTLQILCVAFNIIKVMDKLKVQELISDKKYMPDNVDNYLPRSHDFWFTKFADFRLLAMALQPYIWLLNLHILLVKSVNLISISINNAGSYVYWSG